MAAAASRRRVPPRHNRATLETRANDPGSEEETDMSVEISAGVEDRDIPQSRASEIKKVDLWIFSYPMVGVRGGIDMPGVKSDRLRLAVRIETRDGAWGSYVGGQANSLAQATACARAVIGLDSF